jgi:hypothetical protein
LDRPLNNVHWANVEGSVSVDQNCPDIAYATVSADESLHCLGDIAGGDPHWLTGIWDHGQPDGEVIVDDLLAVIIEWGDCPTEPRYVCRADIDGCDNAVNVNDLLAVIGHWEACNGAPSDFPESLSECFNTFCSGLTGAQYTECVERCAEPICSQTPTPPDCD